MNKKKRGRGMQLAHLALNIAIPLVLATIIAFGFMVAGKLGLLHAFAYVL